MCSIEQIMPEPAFPHPKVKVCEEITLENLKKLKKGKYKDNYKVNIIFDSISDIIIRDYYNLDYYIDDEFNYFPTLPLDRKAFNVILAKGKKIDLEDRMIFELFDLFGLEY